MLTRARLHASPLAAVTAIDAQAEELLEGGAFSLRKFESVNDVKGWFCMLKLS